MSAGLTHPDYSAFRRMVDPLFRFAGKRVKQLFFMFQTLRFLSPSPLERGLG